MDLEKILEIGKTTLAIEIEELSYTQKNLNESFAKVVTKIFGAKGKLVVVGIGKSAHVGRKMVATLNSTGTPSQFLHAAEALHGDLGLLEKEDVVLCLSNSGNSPEIVALAPILKNYASYLIGMTGNPRSRLAEVSDLILSTFVNKEADPNRLAPTSSTTVQMALGDAIAVALMELRNFDQNDFAKLHPGGSLGKNLIAKVEQFINDNKPEVGENSGIRDIIISVSASKHGITVVTKDENILGVITDGDLRRMLIKNEQISNITAKDIMSVHPKTIEKTAFAREAMAILKDNNVGQLVVTDHEKYVGIIDIHTLLDEGII